MMRPMHGQRTLTIIVYMITILHVIIFYGILVLFKLISYLMYELFCLFYIVLILLILCPLSKIQNLHP